MGLNLSQTCMCESCKGSTRLRSTAAGGWVWRESCGAGGSTQGIGVKGVTGEAFRRRWAVQCAGVSRKLGMKH